MSERELLPPHMTAPSRLGGEISITGKWVPTKPSGFFGKSAESEEMLREWNDIHADARQSPGVLATEINHAVGEDAVLIHHVFESAEALGHYFSTTATQHMAALTAVARPELHLLRGVRVPEAARAALSAKSVPAAAAEYLFGYVKDEYERPNPRSAIAVTAKWTCSASDVSRLEDLTQSWQDVGRDAYDLEAGLLRFEVYQVLEEDALVIHEVFSDNDELKFHLAKGTAARYKGDIDLVAAPECYYFRGPVSWTIRTYSRFLHLPATYSSRGLAYARAGGSMSDGLDPA